MTYSGSFAGEQDGITWALEETDDSGRNEAYVT